MSAKINLFLDRKGWKLRETRNSLFEKKTSVNSNYTDDNIGCLSIDQQQLI